MWLWVWIVLLVAIPLLLGAGAAGGLWALTHRRTWVPEGAHGYRRSTLAAAAVGLGLTALARFTGFPFWWSAPFEVRQWSWYAVPVVAAVVTITWVLLTSGRSRIAAQAPGGAQTRIPVLPWSISLTVLTLLIVVVSVAAGLASTPDERGRHTEYVVESGTAWQATTTYGWYYSGPILALITVLLLVTVATARLLTRGAPASDIARWHTRNVLAVATGALSLHLSAVLGSLANAASTAAGAVLVWSDVNSSLAQLGTALRAVGYLAEIGGWFCWFTVMIAVVVPFTRHRRHETSPPEAA